MKELDKLKLQLKNLKEQGHDQFTINVDYLLDILSNISEQNEKPNTTGTIDLDGGNFANE
jgi:hypothetical protein